MNRETGQFIPGFENPDFDFQDEDYSQESREDAERYLSSSLWELVGRVVPTRMDADQEELPGKFTALLQHIWELRGTDLDDPPVFNQDYYDEFREYAEEFEQEKRELERHLNKYEGRDLNRVQEKKYRKLRKKYLEKFGELADNSEYYEAKRVFDKEMKLKEVTGRTAKLLRYFSAEDTAVIFSTLLGQMTGSFGILDSDTLRRAEDLVNDWYAEHEGEGPIRQLESEK